MLFFPDVWILICYYNIPGLLPFPFCYSYLIVEVLTSVRDGQHYAYCNRSNMNFGVHLGTFFLISRENGMKIGFSNRILVLSPIWINKVLNLNLKTQFHLSLNFLVINKSFRTLEMGDLTWQLMILCIHKRNFIISGNLKGIPINSIHYILNKWLSLNKLNDTVAVTLL